MQFDNQKTRNVADVAARIMAGESVQIEPQQLDEKLIGNQHQIDANKNNKIDAHDFKLLRSKKKVEEETEELTESHFKVGDEVVCKKSGMEGEVVKVDEPQVGKYYTVKQENGKMVKYAPDELKKEEEDEDEDEDEDKKEMKESAGASKDQETKFHKKLDTLVHKTFGKRKEEMKEEAEQIDEVMFPGSKEYEKKYGQSPQQKLKKKGDTVPTSQGDMTKTDKGVAHRRRFTEMLESYTEGGLKYIASLVKEEPDNEQFTKEVEKAKAKDRGEDRNDKNIAAGKVDAVKVEEEVEESVELQELSKELLARYKEKAEKSRNKELGYLRQSKEREKILAHANKYRNRRIGLSRVEDRLKKEDVELEERSLTEPEMKKKEEIVKSMKKNMKGFKERYGERGKSVAYATATKIAKEKA